MRLAACLLAALLLCAATASRAHKPSDSYLTLDIAGAQAQGRWDIALRDLDFALGLDRDGDGAITWGEVRAAWPLIERLALEKLTVRRGGTACALKATGPLIDEHTDGPYAVMQLSGACPASGNVEVEYRLLFDVDALHEGLARMTVDGASWATAFSASRPVQPFLAPEQGGALQSFGNFVAQGVVHIATGWDHLLFLVALLLPAVMVRREGRWQGAESARAALIRVAAIVTAFTLAHSITLSLAALQWISVPSRWVESAIAASVVLAAIDNIVPILPRARWLFAFVFGLVHGLGFASVLLELSLPPADLAICLVGFNVGVELGQMALVLLVVPLAFRIRYRPAYRRYALTAGSAAIALVAMGWLVERAFVVQIWPA